MAISSVARTSGMASFPWRMVLVVGVLTAVLVALGNWQLGRAAAKAARLSALPGDAGNPLDGVQLQLRGQWLAGANVLLDNRTYQGRAGYYWLAPVQTEDGRRVLVARGWLPAAADRHPPQLLPARGEVVLSGEVRRPPAHPFTLGDALPEGRVWQTLDLAAYRRMSGLPVEDFVLYQRSDSGDGLVREWPPAGGVSADRHRAYALQWYGLALVTALGGAVLVWKRGRS